jgi:glycosyltransferase involved in cell wall biosynthesis
VKVAITHPYSWPEVRRGAERITVETARALASRGHQVTLVTSGSSAGRSEVDGYNVVRLARRHRDALRHERWFARRIMPMLVRGRFDVVHSLMANDALAAVRTRRLGGHRAVYEEMGNPKRSWWATLPDRRTRERLVHQVDVYGCMSRYSLDVLQGEWGRQGTLIPGGVRLDLFHPAAERESRPTVLFSGAIDEPRKGVPLLLDALSELARREPDVQLWLSGPGDAEAMLAAASAEARGRTRVLGLGESQGQAERYGRAWVTALPSRGDSFGMALLESLACGTPIVVADDGAPPELVAPDIGAVCAPDDVASLVDALAKALDLAREPATAERCRAFASRFDWEASLAPRLERVYAGKEDPVTDEVAGRQAVVDRLLANPPVVHYMSFEDLKEGHLTGVWSTEESCYRFLAERCRPGSRTLETGSGMSTILFAAWGAEHRCITPGDEEARAVITYCQQEGISTESLTIDVAYSDAVLPRLDPNAPPLDIVFIDGSHGFPAPMIDWYFGAGRLCRGGVVVIDDLQLPAVRLLVDFLDRDPRWQPVRRTEKWAAFQRGSEGPLTEDWFLQPFFNDERRGWRRHLGRVEARARRTLGPAKRAVLRRLRKDEPGH